MRSVIRVLVLLSLAACGGGGDDDGDGGDPGDGAETDGGTGGGAPDSAPLPYEGLGDSCTGEGQGDCPDGFECMVLQGGTWCTKMCTQGMNAPCEEGYTGPGEGACFIGVDTGGGPGAEFFICGIICDDPDGVIGCETCDGTCPSDLACTGEIMNQEAEVIGLACE